MADGVKPALHLSRCWPDMAAGTTMYPTTLDEVWSRVDSHGLVRMEFDPDDYTRIFRGCAGLVVYQATKQQPGQVYVVVRYPDGQIVWGCLKIDQG